MSFVQDSQKTHQSQTLPIFQKKIHSRNRKAFHGTLSAENRRLRQRRLNRPSLLPVSKSPWRKALASRDDQALITTTGFNYESLKYIFASFAPIFDDYSPFLDEKIVKKHSTKGRKRKIHVEDCVGLVLMWTRTRGSMYSLQMTFGMTMTNFSMYLRFGRRIMVEVLSKDALAKIRIPSRNEIKSYQEAIGERHPNIGDVWATMDGLKLHLQQSGNDEIQEQYYNGWTHDHYVTSVFCFCPDGTIPIAFFNVPGSVHDSQVADWGDIYVKLERVYQATGGKCTVDSAFGGAERPFLIKSSQDDLCSSATTHREIIAEIQKKRAATSMRQSAEWGMRGLQASFPRLKDRFVYEERGECRITLKMITLIYNMRARMVGINQIRNTYMEYLNNDANMVFN